MSAKQFTETQLIEDLQRLSEKIGDSPSTRDVNESTITASLPTYYNYFDSLNEAKEQAGMSVSNSFSPVTKEEIIADIKRLTEELGSPPTTVEFQEDNNAASLMTLHKNFDSYADALEAAGEEPHQARDGEYYGNKLSSTKRLNVLERDDYSCIHCGVSQQNCQKLHADHICQKSNGGSDDMENLRTLCHTCHALRHSEDRVFGTLKSQVDGWYKSVARVDSRKMRQ